MVPKKASVLVIAIFLLVLALCWAPEILAAVQTGYVLDLDGPDFPFNETYFNDSTESQEYDYAGAGSVTYWVNVPRNSTITTFEMNVTGKIQYIYSESINSPGLLGISIGNITTDTGNEMVTGSTKGEANLYALSGQDGSLIWTYNLSPQTYDIYSTDIGNVTDYPGNEIAFGAEDSRVYVLNVDDSGATEAWNKLVIGVPRSVRIANVTVDSPNEVIAGASKVYIYNDTGGLVCNSSTFTVNNLAEGNLSDDAGLEIAVASSDGYVRIINSSCSVIDSQDMGFTLNSITVGNVTDDPYDEVAFGGVDYSVYLLNSSLDTLWSYAATNVVKSVSIGDVVSQAEGNEVIAGFYDKKVYTMNSSGSLVWDYLAENYIESVAVGELTSDPGNEVAAGTGAGNGKLYTFNFDYFPSDVIIDVGANGTTDWQHSQALRDTDNVTGIESSVQYYLDNACGQGMCEVPLEFQSSHAGKLNISDLNVTYLYNTSGTVSYTTLPGEWSKISWIGVNETVGNTSKNISFQQSPAQDVEVMYIKMPPSATYCHFNGSTYQNGTVGSDNVCDVPDFTITQSGSLPGAVLFWEDTMNSDVPVTGNETSYWFTNTTDNFFARKNVYVWNQSSGSFSSILANTTADDASAKGMYFLNVTWEGQECNITPSQDHAACDSGSPVYSSLPCGSENFSVCKKDDFFRWVQPYANSSVMYTSGGTTNLPAGVSDPSVTLNSSYWGDWFNYSLNVSDSEGNDVNVTLHYWLEHEGAWFTGPTVGVSGSGEAWFNITSNKSWVDVNKYNFSYQDFNSSGWPTHSVMNTDDVWGPLVTKHDTSVSHISGNNSVVNRTESVELVVAVNDLSAGGSQKRGRSAFSGLHTATATSTQVSPTQQMPLDTADSGSRLTATIQQEGSYGRQESWVMLITTTRTPQEAFT